MQCEQKKLPATTISFTIFASQEKAKSLKHIPECTNANVHAFKTADLTPQYFKNKL